jgi:hypothetical protein
MQTTVVGTPSFDDASVMIEACSTELLRAGFTREAEAIRGAEVYSVAGAETALFELSNIHVANEDVNNAVRYTVALLRKLIEQDAAMPLAS